VVQRTTNESRRRFHAHSRSMWRAGICKTHRAAVALLRLEVHFARESSDI
jgi:hypothetical protein